MPNVDYRRTCRTSNRFIDIHRSMNFTLSCPLGATGRLQSMLLCGAGSLKSCVGQRLGLDMPSTWVLDEV